MGISDDHSTNTEDIRRDNGAHSEIQVTSCYLSTTYIY